MKSVWVLLYHCSRMPRFAQSLCSIHETEEGANESMSEAKREPMPPQLRKGGRWKVEKWGVLR
jgi:hypothetical protein